MQKTLLIYPPFCTPASPAYSIANLFTFLKNNLPNSYELKALDLNLLFHKLKFPKDQEYFQNFDQNYSFEDYNEKSHQYMIESMECYSKNNKLVINEQSPEFLAELVKEIISSKPDLIAFSVVYSSQVFYTYALIKELNKKKGLKKLRWKITIGGPAVNSKLIEVADKSLANEIELLQEIVGKKVEHQKLDYQKVIDFNCLSLREYFVPEVVYPLRTISACPYQKCAFCTHHGSMKYFEYDLNQVRETILKNKMKKVFFFDDLIPKKRLLELAKIVKPLKIEWICQLRPTKDLDRETLQKLFDSGLRAVMWGVESGSNRVLELIKKGTKVEEVKVILRDANNVGIKNILFIMFGFPTETEAEFLDTINFLNENKEYIDLILASVFGLQKGSPVYKNPEEYGITNIIEKKRTILDEKISYEVSSGLSQMQAEKLWRKYRKRVEKLNKYPKAMNFFREHIMFTEIEDKKN